MSEEKPPYNEGERVIVTDLRTGEQFRGFVVEDRGGFNKVKVRYDIGPLIEVGRGFVRREGRE